MPFWTFLAGTVLGKAGVKVAGQAAFFVTIFSKQHMNEFMDLLRKVMSDEAVDAIEVRSCPLVGCCVECRV